MYLLQYLKNVNIRKITDKMYLNSREGVRNPLEKRLMNSYNAIIT